MPTFSHSDLLRPSLSGPAAVAAAPYTSQACFFSAFFGGPFAAAMMLALNARRLGRLQRDAFWVLFVAAAYALWLYFVYATPTGRLVYDQLHAWLGARAISVADRLLALLAFGLGALLHRGEQRSADLFGLKRPNGWLGGIVLIVAGIAATWGYSLLVFG